MDGMKIIIQSDAPSQVEFTTTEATNIYMKNRRGFRRYWRDVLRRERLGVLIIKIKSPVQPASNEQSE